jgi:hypothetical protein
VFKKYETRVRILHGLQDLYAEGFRNKIIGRSLPGGTCRDRDQQIHLRQQIDGFAGFYSRRQNYHPTVRADLFVHEDTERIVGVVRGEAKGSDGF